MFGAGTGPEGRTHTGFDTFIRTLCEEPTIGRLPWERDGAFGALFEPDAETLPFTSVPFLRAVRKRTLETEVSHTQADEEPIDRSIGLHHDLKRPKLPIAAASDKAEEAKLREQT
eukprot:6421940-Amphidinium_carterae.1